VRGTATTRRSLLVGIGAAPVAVASAAAAAPRSDVEILEQLLRLERRLEGSYEAALERSILGEGLAGSLRDQEREHADGLERTLSARGRRPGPGPGADPRLAAALRERRTFIHYALGLEARAVRAYIRAEASLRDTRLRQPLGAILTTEAQHEVALRAALGEPLLGV
jgi:hypothetical protein